MTGKAFCRDWWIAHHAGDQFCDAKSKNLTKTHTIPDNWEYVKDFGYTWFDVEEELRGTNKVAEKSEEETTIFPQY